MIFAARIFVRQLLVITEAKSRPKDFGGLEFGAADDHQLYDLAKLPFGPAVITGGIWTRMKLHLAGLEDSPSCLRCGLEPDTRMHRLWHCCANKDLVDELDAALTHPMFDAGILHALDFLPSCVKRCGIFPHDSDVPLSQRRLISGYLLCANARASSALAVQFRRKQGKPLHMCLQSNLTVLEGRAMTLIEASLVPTFPDPG